ncbi:MAG: CRISPR-associated endoribonuclease Cas6 [Caldimicrobium sp.]
MRLKALVQAHKIPIIYRHRFLSLIKEALILADPMYKQIFYEDKVYTKKPKPFTFCVLFPKGTERIKERFLLNDHYEVEDYVFYPPESSFISFIISSSDYEFLMHLYNGLLKIKSFPFSGEINLVIKKILYPVQREIHESEVILKTLSPILIEDEEEKPVLKGDEFPFEKFNREFNIIHDKKLKDLRGEGLKEELRFEPLPNKWRKQVVKHALGKLSSNLGKPYGVFTCFEGQFKLSGHPEDINMLYKIGLGLRTAQGFGMVEVV